MGSRRVVTAIAVLTGALLAVQLFGHAYTSSFARLLFDLFSFGVALALFSRIPPPATTRGELGRFALGPFFFIIATTAGQFLAELVALDLIITGRAGWLLLFRVLTSTALAWSALSVIRLGGGWWVRRRRRVVIALILTLALALLDAPTGIVVVVALYIVLFVVPTRWVDEVSGKWGWWVLGLVMLTPIAAMLFSADIEVALTQDIAPAGMALADPNELITSPLFNILAVNFNLFWLLLPVRLVVNLFTGTFGLRVPIWLKLMLTYVFSTLIPALLLLALVTVTVYLGIGTMRAHAVRSLIYDDLVQLEDRLDQGRIEAYAPADSVAEAVYMRLQPGTTPRSGTIPPPPRTTPSSGRSDVDFGDMNPLATMPEEALLSSRLDSLTRPLEGREVWVKVADKRATWSLPDTLPLFPGWTDSSLRHHGILPIGKGRSAFAAAVSKRAGSRIVAVALRPLNHHTLERYKQVVGTDISVAPYSELAAGVSAGLAESDGTSIRIRSGRNVDRRWRDTETIRTFSAADTSLGVPFYKRSLYHGVSELQVWPSPTADFEQMSGQVSVRTSLNDLVKSLYAPQGLNRITLFVIGVLAALFLLAVLFSTVLGFGINRTITSSVAALRNGTEQLRKGNLAVSIDVKNRDELGDLASSFNQMTTDLRRMMIEVAEKERLEREVQIAREIQVRLLPAVIPQPDGFEIDARSVPALEVGGDYYDVIDLGKNKTLFALGDVSGKGVGAAILMSNLQANLHVLSSQDIPLETVVGELNRQIYRNSTPEMFITFFVGVIDLEKRVLTYVNAGHDLPALIRDGEVYDLEEGGMLLGVMTDVSYQAGRFELEPGDLIVCNSDGLTEAMNEDEVEFGRDRLLECIRTHHENDWTGIDRIFETVREYAGDERAAQDDLTLLVVRTL
ncbi:SpoIIE family protein phosphatase [bacterium]|nr:SpoIIE family protein phosphatase [bacterium]